MTPVRNAITAPVARPSLVAPEHAGLPGLQPAKPPRGASRHLSSSPPVVRRFLVDCRVFCADCSFNL